MRGLILLLPAFLTAVLVGGAVSSAQDQEWVAMTVFAVLAIPPAVVALRYKKRVENS